MPSGRLRIGYPVAGTYSLVADFATFGLNGQSATLSKTTNDANWQPDKKITFSGTHGAAFTTIDPVGSEYVFGSYSGGFGSTYNTAQTRGGRASSLQSTIASGSDGNGGDGRGLFGLSIGLPEALMVGQGSWLHIGCWVKFASGFNGLTNNSIGASRFGLKFFRLQNNQGNSRIDYEPSTDGSGVMRGWYYSNEFGGVSQATFVQDSTSIPTLNQWCFVETATYLHASAASAIQRIWVDGVFAMEFANTNLKYRNSSGTISNITVPATPSLPNSAALMEAFLLFTNWNGNSPQANTVWIDSVAFHSAIGTLPGTDEFGNPNMGNGSLL